MEIKMKEKTQENNLLDFKLRDMARNTEIDNGFLKPHSGIHLGLLSQNAGAALPLSSQIAIEKSVRNRGPSQISQSMDFTSIRVPSLQSKRPGSRSSIASRASRFD